MVEGAEVHISTIILLNCVMISLLKQNIDFCDRLLVLLKSVFNFRLTLSMLAVSSVLLSFAHRPIRLWFTRSTQNMILNFITGIHDVLQIVKRG